MTETTIEPNEGMLDETLCLLGQTTIPTVTGKSVDLANVLPSDIDIRDIAHSLSHICRFTGHTGRHYSVAQHSLQVCKRCPREYWLEGLLHDGVETYINDVSRPFKNLLNLHAPGVLKQIEKPIEQAIALQFGLTYPWPQCVKEADNAVLKIELACFWEDGFLDHTGKRFTKADVPKIDWIEANRPQDAKAFFLARFYEIQRDRKARYLSGCNP